MVDGKLCIKIALESKDTKAQRLIRDYFRERIKEVIGEQHPIVDSGRLGGKTMTLCKVIFDLLSTQDIQDFAKIIPDIISKLESISRDIPQTLL